MAEGVADGEALLGEKVLSDDGERSRFLDLSLNEAHGYHIVDTIVELTDVAFEVEAQGTVVHQSAYAAHDTVAGLACKHPLFGQSAKHFVGHLAKQQWLNGILDAVLHAAVLVGQNADVSFFFLVAEPEVPILSYLVGVRLQFQLLTSAEGIHVGHHAPYLPLAALAGGLGHIAIVNGGIQACCDVDPSGYSHKFVNRKSVNRKSLRPVCADGGVSERPTAYPALAM